MAQAILAQAVGPSGAYLFLPLPPVGVVLGIFYTLELPCWVTWASRRPVPLPHLLRRGRIKLSWIGIRPRSCFRWVTF